MFATDVEIASSALVLLGEGPISSMDEDSDVAAAVRAIYPFCRDAMLAAHRWGFALAQRQLSQLQTTPVADYDYAYTLPADFIQAISLGTTATGRGRGMDYRIAEWRLHTDADPAVLTYIFRAPEENWPPHFVQLMRAQLRAELCMPVTEDEGRYNAFMQMAELEMRRAKRIDSQQDTPIAIEDFPLISVRG